MIVFWIPSTGLFRKKSVIYYKYDEFKRFLDNTFEMPDKMVSILVRFLEQNNGTLSQRAKIKEFSLLNGNEVKEIENHFKEIFENH